MKWFEPMAKPKLSTESPAARRSTPSARANATSCTAVAPASWCAIALTLSAGSLPGGTSSQAAVGRESGSRARACSAR